MEITNYLSELCTHEVIRDIIWNGYYSIIDSDNLTDESRIVFQQEFVDEIYFDLVERFPMNDLTMKTEIKSKILNILGDILPNIF